MHAHHSLRYLSCCISLLAYSVAVPEARAASATEDQAIIVEPAAVGAAAAGADTIYRPDLSSYFGEIDGSFVLLEGRSGQVTVHDPARARTRFLPASTYKIPNTLIALETGVASGPDYALSWDSVAAPRQGWWPGSWARDQTLRSALPASVVWYYQELARRIGPERMRSYLGQFGYGNQDISGGIDEFWLTGGLRISPLEQVEFLRRFYFAELGVSERSTRIAKELLVLEETPAYRLSGKSGWAGLGEPGVPEIGWLVGYLERGDDVYFFATNIEIKTNADAAARLGITKAILRGLGLLEEKAPMNDRASGTFEVRLAPLTPYNEAAEARLGRMSIDKEFRGDLVATSKGEMLTAMTAVDGSAAYVAIERVSGKLDGRGGTFALQHTGIMDRGASQLTVTVVPDSGTGELAGLAGTMAIIVADGKHSYEFEYTLPSS
jgi:beta-lactamase class D